MIFITGFCALFLSSIFIHAQEGAYVNDESFANKGNLFTPALARAVFDSSHSFDVLHYRLDLNFPYVSSAFSGMMTATCLSNEEGLEEVSLHMVDLTMDSVLAQGERVSAIQTSEEIEIPLGGPVAYGDTFTVAIAYHGAPEYQGFYFYEMCAFTFSQPVYARRWFPCYDVPWDKATVELHITVPKGVEVASVGLLEEREVSQDGAFETFHWKSRDPMSTYLVCVTMSDEYARWSDWYITPQGDSIEIAYYIFQRDSAAATRDFVNMVEAMELFSDLFGPYPFEKYGMAEIEPAPFGGMEHQTMTTISSSWVRGDRSREYGLVHELAHMWWGDVVTLDEWPAIWLNEGFAVYSEALWAENHIGLAEFRGYMEYSKGVYLDRTRDRDFPIYDPDPLFHYGITYKKGGWVLHMLRHVVGDDNFFTALNTYYETYKYGNASIEEFQTICETLSGMDLDWFFQEWIYDMGYPKVQYSWSSRALQSGSYEVTLSLYQYHSEGPIFRMPLDVRIQGSASSKDTTVWMENEYDEFVCVTDFYPTNIQIDPDGWVLMDTEYMYGGIKRSDVMPDRFVLYHNYPNPFNESTTIYYNVPNFEGVQWDIRIVVYDLLGRYVRTIVEASEMPGCYRVEWDGTDDRGVLLPTGVYIIELSTDGFTQRHKAVLVR
jgi:aminopeptidase N